MTTITGSVHYGAMTIDYEVRPAARKTVAIDVYPDQHVEVRAPLDVALDLVAAIVHKRASWIVRQQRYFADYPPDARGRAYVSGESYRYLGRQYRLKVHKVQPGEATTVRLQRGLLQVTAPPSASSKQIGRAVDSWYRTRAQQVFREQLDACFTRLASQDVPYPSLELRWMKTRWGSCSRTGVIRLNPRLIQAPRACITYVIVHELCHLKEHNHSKRYYALLDRVLPEWRELRQRLNSSEFR